MEQTPAHNQRSAVRSAPYHLNEVQRRGMPPTECQARAVHQASPSPTEKPIPERCTQRAARHLLDRVSTRQDAEETFLPA